MVVQFAKDHYQLSEPEISQLALQVRDGDVSVVLRAYENEIKVSGDGAVVKGIHGLTP
jgi:nuclear-control-of-ATPase protein 2